MMHLNNGKYLKNIIGKQGGNYSQKKTFSIDNVIIDNSETISITSLFLLVTIWQKILFVMLTHCFM